MRVGLIAPPWIPLPPPGYGGIEIVVTELAQGLAARGHDVAVLAGPNSEIPGVEVHSTLTELPDEIGEPHAERAHVSAVAETLGSCDVILDHSGVPGAVAASKLGIPYAHVVHGPMSGDLRPLYRHVRAAIPGMRYVAISDSQRRLAPELPWIGTCHNGLDFSGVPTSEKPGEYLAFLGRVSPEKGLAEAIAIARSLDMPLKVAAKCREDAEKRHFAEIMGPTDTDGVDWLGEIGHEEKYALLAGAAAMLFPIQWEEPFGLVMIESMATGTPVVATPRGAVPEVILDGRTGVIRADHEGLVEGTRRIANIDRSACTVHAIENFSTTAMASAYERVLVDLVATDDRLTSRASRAVAPLVPADAA